MENNFFQSEGFNHPNCWKTFGVVHGTVYSNHFCACGVYPFWNKWRNSVCSRESSTVLTNKVSNDVMPSSVVRSVYDFTDCECRGGITVIASYHKHKGFFWKRYCFLTDYFSCLMQKSNDCICWFCWFQAKHGNIIFQSNYLFTLVF